MAAEQGGGQYDVRFRSLALVAATDHRTLARIRVLLRTCRAVLLDWAVLRGPTGGNQSSVIRVPKSPRSVDQIGLGGNPVAEFFIHP